MANKYPHVDEVNVSTYVLQEDGDDEIKREQLGTLALINGTYRPPGTQL